MSRFPQSTSFRFFTIFVQSFNSYRGTLERLGTLDTAVSYQTDSWNGTYGRIHGRTPQLYGTGSSNINNLTNMVNGGQSSSFWALNRGRSRTNPIERHVISLMKIGPNLLTNIQIPQRAFYQILEPGSNVGFVVSNQNNLMYVCNKDMKAELGVRFSMFGYVLVSLIAAIIATFCFVNFLNYTIQLNGKSMVWTLLLFVAAAFISLACIVSGIESRKRYYAAVMQARS